MRFKGKLNFQDTIKNIILEQLLQYKEVVRFGVPDEVRPTIILYYNNGDAKKFSKWANDKNELFDKTYNDLLKLGDVESLKKEFEGKFVWDLNE